MPESAEVKLSTDFLSRALKTKTISNWEFISGQYKNKNPNCFTDFHNSLPLQVEEVNCKGKFIYMICGNGDKKFYILHSMRLSGSWKNEKDNHSRWYIELDNGRKIWFRDTRCLATLKFTEDENVLKSYLNKLGSDILSEDFTLSIWYNLLNKYKNRNITSFLMDQSVISGCGNYIKAESLYEAKISPLRKVSSLTDKEKEDLYQAVRMIPRIAYMNKGFSLRDYSDHNGRKGFQEFHLKIYGKKFATKTKTADGRTTYWDEKVQK